MKSTEELFQEAYDNCEAQDISEVDIKGFIEHCEALYKMTTSEFHRWYEANEFEGNVEQQLWYQYKKQ